MSSLSVQARRLIVSAFVLFAGLLLMLARTSPALAADSGHGQGKAQDHTSASAVSNRHDSPTAKEDQHIGGGGDGGGKGKGGGGTGGSKPWPSNGGSSSHTSGGSKTGSGTPASSHAAKGSSGDGTKTSGPGRSHSRTRSAAGQ